MSKIHVMKWKHLFLMVLVLVLNIKGKTWRDIPKYYKSLGYAAVINAIYYKLCKRHLVWEFTPNHFNWRLLRIIHIFIMTPLLVLLFLSKCPKTGFTQLGYLLKWVFFSSIVEYTAHKQRMIQYKHGWNIFWSGVLYLMMYVYSSLFSKRPVVTCFISFCSIVFFIKKFKVPIKSKHPFSRRFDAIVDCFYHSRLEDLL